ncbi:MAG: ATP-binding protein [Campylobacterota bacterium]|nr:ATP-binding protein [Campylobacterota bacterium]
MIKNISFSNFYSFYEKHTISFEVNQNPSPSLYDISYNDERINKVVSIIGANGSGKTQLIRPLAFISWFISASYMQLKPLDEILYKAHGLHLDEKTELSITFIIDMQEYKYNLTLQNNQVLEESLHQKTSRSFSYIFKRERENIDDEFDYKTKGFDLTSKVARKVKGNASIISAAYMNDGEVAKKFIDYFTNSFHSNITVSGRDNYSENYLIDSARFFYDNQILNEKMNKIICELDLGLSSVKINEIEVPVDDDKLQKMYLPVGVHKDNEGRGFELPFFDESSGTKSLFVQLRRILPILEVGGIAIIDELDNDLHPHMLPILIELFKFEHTNPNNAQIIFTCHTPEILNILKKHQIYLVEKKNLQSEAWRLDEMTGLRSDDNLYAKYYAGSLGATPDV